MISRLADPGDPLMHERTAHLHDRVGGMGTNLADAVLLGVGLLGSAPHGSTRRLIVVTDGADNRDREKLPSAIKAARRARVSVDAVPMGDDRAAAAPGTVVSTATTAAADHFDLTRLRELTGGTWHGRIIGAKRLRELADALKSCLGPEDPASRRAWATVVACDLSRSMALNWGETTRIDALEAAVRRLALVLMKS